MNQLVQHLSPRYDCYWFSSQSEKNSTYESSNWNSRSRSFLRSLSIRLTNCVCHEWTRPTALPQVLPHQVSPQSKKNYTRESDNKLSRSKSLIGSSSICLMSYISHERTRPTFYPKVHTYQVSPRSKESYTRDSNEKVWWTDRKTDRKTDMDWW